MIPSIDVIYHTHVCVPVILVLRKQRQAEPWCLLASFRLAEKASPRFSERPSQKKNVRIIEEDNRTLSSVPHPTYIHMHVYAHAIHIKRLGWNMG